ncbi:MAG: hypothetical protein HQL41_04490 [Alphaproteobacteria bacterium]|nr:hypothetical protein [Alphaproteobacteria bacterium]
MTRLSAGDARTATIKSAFGAENRNRLVALYFHTQSERDAAASTAWRHVYRLLLWPDPTTGLAHCYESDKCQPGKPWYSRSLAFHAWLSAALETSPGMLAEQIDWLFLRAAEDLAAEVMRKASRLGVAAERQMRPYLGGDFPVAGQDRRLVSILKDALGDHLDGEPPPETWQRAVERVRQYLALENKRKNLVGEGFEDVLAHIVRRTWPDPAIAIHTRRVLQDLPGFGSTRRGEKPNKVDLAIIRPNKRMLVTAKWSVRADREKQFSTEYGEYIAAESDGRPFEYVFITNEFDPARLVRACEKLAGNAAMFSHVVHINTDALKAAYGGAHEDSMRTVVRLIDDGRLISLGQWLATLGA